MTRKLFVFVAVLALSGISLVGQASRTAVTQAALLVGTWELNVAKSSITPGPLPKNETRTYELNGQRVRAVHKGIGPDGKPTHVDYTASFDGKDYPYTGSTLYDTLALTPVDTHTASFIQKINGKVALTGTRVISKDRKTMTVSGKGTNRQGQATDIRLVFEKR